MSFFTKIIPTKTQLLRLKKRLIFLKNGYDLLELKSESLLIQIKSFYRKVREKRKNTINKVVEAFQFLKKAEIVSGEHALKLIADVNRWLIDYKIDINYRSAFGFTVPKIKHRIQKEKHFPHYGFLDTSFFLDMYYIAIQDAIEQLLKLAELESTLFIMAEEYNKIRRRINALEDIIIPQTEMQIKIIENILEENEIEEFIRLKNVKKKLEGLT
ncbi:MAG: V-type ATP synthase subunit D [Promethearchaeota archaeon]